MMNTNVKYNDDAEPYRINVNIRKGLRVSFAVRGSSAIATSVEPAEGSHKVYCDDISRIMDHVEKLPFVQAVALDEYDEVQEE